MSTLSVSSIQNTASPTTNIVVNADGSVTLGLYRVPGVAPTPVQTGTLWYDIGGAGLVIWNGASWAGVGGGGGGTVTGVTGTAPIVSSGGAAPAISITPATSGAAGSMSAADKAKLDGAATIVSAVTGTLPITVATGTSTPVIAINAATAAAAGSIEIATLAEAATGTDATLALTPSTGVPKDAATMTGAALIPGGNDAARPTTTVTGMTRYNNQVSPAHIEYWNGSAWAAAFDWVTSGGNITPSLPNLNLQFNSGYGSNATAYGCRAWVNFDGTVASPTIRGNGNVSSVTKITTGVYAVNFTTAMPDANYGFSLSYSNIVGITTTGYQTFTTPPTTSSIVVATAGSAVGTLGDSNYVCVSIFR